MYPLGMPEDKKGLAKNATHFFTVMVTTIIFHILRHLESSHPVWFSVSQEVGVRRLSTVGNEYIRGCDLLVLRHVRYTVQ